MDLQLSSYFGWGVYAINLMLNWSHQQQELLVTSAPLIESRINITPLEICCDMGSYESFVRVVDWCRRISA